MARISEKMMPSRLATLGLWCATFAWGASFFLVKKATLMVGIWPYMSYRFGTTVLFLALIFPKKLFFSSKSVMLKGLTLGLILFLTIWTQTVGLQKTSATRSGFITALYVPFTPLVGWLLFKHRVFVRQILAALVAVVGLYFLTNPVGKGWEHGWDDVNPGDLWTLACALLAGAHIVVTEKFSRQERDGIALGMWQFVGCCFFVLFSILAHPASVPNPAGWNLVSWPSFAIFSALFNAIVCTAFGFNMQIFAQKHIGALKAALIFAMEAPFSGGFAFVFLGETMALRELFGAAIVFLTSIVPERWLKKPLEES